jgi:hypothetical protein
VGIEQDVWAKASPAFHYDASGFAAPVWCAFDQDAHRFHAKNKSSDHAISAVAHCSSHYDGAGFGVRCAGAADLATAEAGSCGHRDLLSFIGRIRRIGRIGWFLSGS